MVKVLIGDLFDSQAQTLVNTVNTVGVMGKGIALEFKKRFPAMYEDYVRRCEQQEVSLGRPYLYRQLMPPWILNFPTKGHWRSIARLDDIVVGLHYLLENYGGWGIQSLAMPPLGCGEGQLEWRIVGPTLYRHLAQMTIPVDLYAPYGTPHLELQPGFLENVCDTLQEMPEARYVSAAAVALVDILKRIEEQPYHYPVGRTIFQKIAYVATREGLPTGLNYERGSFGPYAPELKRLTTRLVNNGLIREEPLGRMFAVRVGPTFADARRAYAPDLAKWEDLIERVTDLFLRVDTNEAEIAATVLFAASALANNERHPTEKDVLAEVMRWKQKRRPPLDESDVALTVRNLAALGWMDVGASLDLPVLEASMEGQPIGTDHR